MKNLKKYMVKLVTSSSFCLIFQIHPYTIFKMKAFAIGEEFTDDKKHCIKTRIGIR